MGNNSNPIIQIPH